MTKGNLGTEFNWSEQAASWKGVDFNEEDYVTKLEMRSCQLVMDLQEIRPVMASSLRILDLRGNRGITGNIRLLSNCVNLQSLMITTSDGVVGDISALGSCRELVDIVLYLTGVSGNVASLSALVMLKKINFRSCKDITGDVSALTSCPKLQVITLGDTHVTGDKRVLEKSFPTASISL